MFSKSVATTASVILWMTAFPVFGQNVIRGTEDLDFDRTESWAMKYFTSVSLTTIMGVPRELEPGAIILGFEGGWVPQLSEDERRVGFDGTKVEDLNKTSFFGRIQATFGLPGKYSLMVGYVPPIDLNGAQPNLFSAGIARPLVETDALRLGMRVFGQLGSIDGDFTCSAEDVAGGDDPELNPFGCEQPSEDEVSLRHLSFEASNAFKLRNSRLEPYVAFAVNYMDLKFQVNALYSGFQDETLLLTDGFTLSVRGGLSYSSDRWSVAGEVFYTPLSVVRPPGTESQNDGLFNVRGVIAYRLR